MSVLLLLLAFLTGFAGLCFEVASFRDCGLVLGLGSGAQALVLGSFLFGLGLGGLGPVRFPAWKERPLSWAGILQIAVAAWIPIWGFLLPGPEAPAVRAAVLAAGGLFLAGLSMGAAFPLLFPVLTRRGLGPGVLQAVNLAGSVAGALAGAVFLVPLLGIETSLRIAALLYLLSGVVLLLAGRGTESSPSRGTGPGPAGGPAAGARTERAYPAFTRFRPLCVAAGFATLACELWIPRRAVFVLGGFLPTFAGTLAGAVALLAAGSLLAEGARVRRIFGKDPERMAALAALGALGSVLLFESLAGTFAAFSPDGLGTALAAAFLLPFVSMAPALLPLGALLPLVLRAGGSGGVPAARAGRVFFWFGLGAALAALALPEFLDLPLDSVREGRPSGLSPVRILPLVGGLVLLLAQRGPVPRIAAVLGAALLAFPPLELPPMLEGSRNLQEGLHGRRVLRERADRLLTASVVEDRLLGDRLLYTDEFAAAGGRFSSYMRALGLLCALEAPEGDLAVLGLGTGRSLAAVLRGARGRSVHLVEVSRAVLACSSDFPENSVPGPPPRIHLSDGRRFLARRAPGSLAGILLEPLLPQAPASVHLYSTGFYEAAKRALVEGGVLVQWLPTHALPRGLFLSLVATFAAAFPEGRLLLLDESCLLLGAKGGPPPSLEERLDACPESLRGEALVSGLAAGVDGAVAGFPLARADLRRLPLVRDDRPSLELEAFAPPRRLLGYLSENLRVLCGWLEGTEAAGPRPRARLHRFRARLSLARVPLEPAGPSSRLAVLDLEKAVELCPESTLLRRELRRARAVRDRQAALLALASGRRREAARLAALALEDGGLDPVLLGIRVFPDETGKPDPGSLRLLASLLPTWRTFRGFAARRDLGFAPLLDLPEGLLGPVSPEAFPEPPVGAEAFASVLLREPERMRVHLMRRPYACVASWVGRGRLLREMEPSLRAAFGRLMDSAGLEAWRSALERDPSLLAFLAPVLPKDLPLPPWLGPVAERLGPRGRAAWLDCLEGRRDETSLGFLLDVLCWPDEQAPSIRRAWVEWRRRRPGDPVFDPALPRKERIARVRALRRGRR